MKTLHPSIVAIAGIAVIGIILFAVVLPSQSKTDLNTNFISHSTTVHLAIVEIPSVPQEVKFVSLSEQQLFNLPSFSSGLTEADKLFSLNIPYTTCDGCAPMAHQPLRPDSYVTSITPAEATLALSIMGFHDIPRPGQTVIDIHGTTVEYNGKYYSIVIMGI
jgi:hypothetical protein